MMGYLKIPKIRVTLPIYHGTEERVLQSGVGHVGNTSLPVGGDSTHSVLTGHRGLPSAELFTDLDQLEVGDVFFVKVMHETLAYEVDQILTVLPTQIDALKIEQGQDLMTLVTCTPYSVNTHRLLVRGHRIPYEEKIEEQAMAQKARMPLHLKILLIGLICLGLIWGTMKLISLRTQPKKQKRRKKNEKRRRH